MFLGFLKRVASRIAYGWKLGIKSVGVVFKDKTLMLFPLASMTCAAITIGLIYIAVGPDKWHLVLNTEVNDRGVQLINQGYYIVVLIAYLGIAFVTVFFNVALMGSTDISMSERDSKFRDGFNIAVRSIPSILIWSVLSSTVGVIVSILDREKHISKLLRKVLGAAWSILTYFTVAVVVLEKRFIFPAMHRSVNVMTETWGENLGAQFGLRWFLILFNVPLLGLYAATWYLTDRWYDLIVVLGVGYFAFTIVLAQTVKSVLTVILYKFATKDEVPEGWNRALLQEAFVSRSEKEDDEAPSAETANKD